MKKILFVGLYICLSLNLQSQTIYIRAGKVFDGIHFIGGKVICIDDGLIEGLYELTYIIPDGSELIDATDCTVLPGFIDSHIHFMGTSLPYVNAMEKFSFGRLASEGISNFPEHRLHLLLNGITSIIDMGAPLRSYQRVEKAIKKREIMGPEVYYPGPLITAPDGHPAGTFYRGQHDLILNGTFQVSDINKATKEIQWLANQNVDFIKIVYDRGWYLKGGIPRLDPAVAKVIVEEAHKLGLKVIAHVGSEDEAWEMVDINVDGIEHGFKVSSDSILEVLRDRKISFTPTLSAYDHYAPAAVKFMEETIKRASILNVPITVGTDFPASSGKFCGDDLFKGMNHLENIGISRTDALRGATYYGAKKIGREKEIGFLGKGYHANLIFYKGQIDTGRLIPARVLGTMINGDMVTENGKIIANFQSLFKTRKTLVFPYCFYDLVSEYNIGVSYTNFNLFDTGTSMFSDASWSIRNMWSANFQIFIPSPIKKTSLKASFHFDNLNRLFYGIGNNTQKTDHIEYSSISLKESISATTILKRNWKISYSIILDQFKTDRTENSIPLNVTGSEGGNQTLLMLSLIYDSRDHQNNPWEGTMISLTPEFSPSFLGSNNNFSRLTLDIRGYISPIPRNILCARLLDRQAFGDVPFYYMPDFGGSSIGRGYHTSRFLNKIGTYAQIE